MRKSFFEELYEIMKEDERVIFLTSDTGAIVLDDIRKDFPSRCTNVGIAEANMASVAAGLAMCGKIVYIYAIIPFVTMRCYEQIRVDICCQNLNVKVVGVGAGMDYSTLGPTHHGHEDVALMRMLPGMTILSPADNLSSSAFARISHSSPGPVYVRLERYAETIYTDPTEKFLNGLNVLEHGEDLCIIATGRMITIAKKVSKSLRKQFIKTQLIDLYRIKPLNKTLLRQNLKGIKNIVTLEEHSIIGGLGSAISDCLAETNGNAKLLSLGMPDDFCRQYGSRDYLHKLIGIDVENVTKKILGWIK